MTNDQTGSELQLHWRKFETLTSARSAFPNVSCIYVQTDSQGKAIRVGKATQGLVARYRGGTGYALDAGLHGSGNAVFVAAVPAELASVVEAEIIWSQRGELRYNNRGSGESRREE